MIPIESIRHHTEKVFLSIERLAGEKTNPERDGKSSKKGFFDRFFHRTAKKKRAIPFSKLPRRRRRLFGCEIRRKKFVECGKKTQKVKFAKKISLIKFFDERTNLGS